MYTKIKILCEKGILTSRSRFTKDGCAKSRKNESEFVPRIFNHMCEKVLNFETTHHTSLSLRHGQRKEKSPITAYLK